MLFQSIAASGALASAVLLGVLSAAPSYAATIGTAGNWSSDVADVAAPASALLSFTNFQTISAGTGFLTGYSLEAMADLPLILLGGITYGIDTSLFDGDSWKVYSNGAGEEIAFNLNTDATWQRFFDPVDDDASWTQVGEYSGTYILPDGTAVAGTGFLNMSSSGRGSDRARTFQQTQAGEEPQVIPLPASGFLLLGASGLLGFAGFRRRSG
jgi:hypothetical protein